MPLPESASFCSYCGGTCVLTPDLDKQRMDDDGFPPCPMGGHCEGDCEPGCRDAALRQCDCTKGCKEPASNSYPDADLCHECIGDGCVTHEQARKADTCSCGKTATECAEWPENCTLATGSVDDVSIVTDSYLLVTRNVRPDGWSPKMLWYRLRRRTLTVYMEPPRPWTIADLTAALMMAGDEGIEIEVYVGLATYTDPGETP